MNMEYIVDSIVLQADIAKRTKSDTARRTAIRKLSKAAERIIRPEFDVRRLKAALEYACVKRPDFGDPVVFESNKGLGKIISPGVLHLDGSFDLALLAEKYFEREWRDLK